MPRDALERWKSRNRASQDRHRASRSADQHRHDRDGVARDRADIDAYREVLGSVLAEPSVTATAPNDLAAQPTLLRDTAAKRAAQPTDVDRGRGYRRHAASLRRQTDEVTQQPGGWPREAGEDAA